MNANIETRPTTRSSGTRADWIRSGRRVSDLARSVGMTRREVVVTLDDGSEVRESASVALYHRGDTEAVH